MTGTAAAAPTSSASAAASATTYGAALGKGVEGTMATSEGSR